MISLPTPPRIAAHAGPYPLLTQLGEGGTGTVYESVSPGPPPSPIALKLLSAPPGQPESWGARLRPLTSLSHPNLVRIFRCGRIEDRYFVEMELLSAPTLRQQLTPGHCLPARTVLALVAQLGGALTCLHRHGLLHLDVKLENVLCVGPDEVKLSDLDGVVPRGADELAWERGSPDTCAPEQRFGLPVDDRADVFALAGLAYELLTGAVPGRVYVPCGRHVTGLAGDVDDALRRARARDRFDRPASVVDFLAQLTRALAPTAASLPPFTAEGPSPR